MNKVVLLGRLTKNPEIRYAEGENPVAVGPVSYTHLTLPTIA